MIYPTIFSVPRILAAHGVKHAIVAPGSRNAPLTLAFARNKDIGCHVIPDERSAAFIALGMAQQTHRPVVLVCTSGSAALNFAPAVAEAFFSNVPLIVLTADRPPEWIDQYDGQTIRQTAIFGQHVKLSLTTPADLTHNDAQWHLQRQINEAAIASLTPSPGPVHINFPFREPIYPNADTTTGDLDIKIFRQAASSKKLSDNTTSQLKSDLATFKRKLIVVGQGMYQPDVLQQLSTLSHEHYIPVVGDIISNIHSMEEAVLHADVFLGSSKSGLHQSLQPDLLITFGKSILAKNLKLMLRQYQATEHWHITIDGEAPDTYQSLTRVIPADLPEFLTLVAESDQNPDFERQKQENYFHIWQIEERKVKRHLQEFFPHDQWGEFEFIKTVIDSLPACNLHLANSMTVRYANFIGTGNGNITVYCNRGTSGIDGSNSTAVGHAITSDKLNVLITGDLAFFYDRNAFWHHENYSNLRIILLNNHGGSIFRMIKGPASQPELEEYFETRQHLNARLLCEEFGFEYLLCDKKSKVKNYISRLLEDDGNPRLLEIETQGDVNQQILDAFKAGFNELK